LNALLICVRLKQETMILKHSNNNKSKSEVMSCRHVIESKLKCSTGYWTEIPLEKGLPTA
jgi:hypothetical protein